MTNAQRAVKLLRKLGVPGLTEVKDNTHERIDAFQVGIVISAEGPLCLWKGGGKSEQTFQPDAVDIVRDNTDHIAFVKQGRLIQGPVIYVIGE